MILSLESYSAVIIRRDLRRDCPPYDPVTPPIPPISLGYPRSKLSFSFAIVPTYWAAAYLFIIIIMIVIMIILCLVCVRCANASAPDNAVSGRARNFTFAALLRVLNTLWNFRLLSDRFVIVPGNKFPQLMITMIITMPILCDGWRVATMPSELNTLKW